MDGFEDKSLTFWKNYKLTPGFDLKKFLEAAGGKIDELSSSCMPIGKLSTNVVGNHNFFINLGDKPISPSLRIEVLKEFGKFLYGGGISDSKALHLALSINAPQAILFEKIYELGKEKGNEITSTYDIEYDTLADLQKTFALNPSYLDTTLRLYAEDYEEWLKSEMFNSHVSIEVLNDIASATISLILNGTLPLVGPRIREVAQNLNVNFSPHDNSKEILGKICDHLLNGESNKYERESFAEIVLRYLEF